MNNIPPKKIVIHSKVFKDCLHCNWYSRL